MTFIDIFTYYELEIFGNFLAGGILIFWNGNSRRPWYCRYLFLQRPSAY